MLSQRDKVLETNSELVNKLDPLFKIFDNSELVQKLKAEKHFTLDFLKENYDVCLFLFSIFYHNI